MNMTQQGMHVPRRKFRDTNQRTELRLMIAERGINGLLEDLGAVCDEIAETKVTYHWTHLWKNRADELRELGAAYNKSAEYFEELDKQISKGEDNA